MPAPSKFSPLKGYVRMSWAPENLYNLFRLSFKPPEHIASSLSFKRTSMTMFQQKWSSKRLLRAYHGDWLQERKFKRRFLPNALPPWENKEKGKQPESSNFTSRGRDDQQRIPLASLMWREVEARLDTLVFRSCFAHSVYEAKRLVTQGHVKLNGKVTRDPNILLEPGDILTVDPKEMYLLRASDAPFTKQVIKGEPDTEAATSEGGEEVSEEAATPSQESISEEGETIKEGEETSASSAPARPAAPTPSKPKTSRTANLPGLPFNLPDYASPFLFIPAYLEVSFSTCSSIYVRHPTARPGYSEIPSPYDADGEIARLTWEYYKSVGRRRRETLVKDWGEEKTPYKQPQFDDKGRRNWTADWEELEDEKRRNRAVRIGRGRWAHRPM